MNLNKNLVDKEQEKKYMLFSLAPLYVMPAEELSTYKNYLDNAINEPEYEIKKI